MEAYEKHTWEYEQFIAHYVSLACSAARGRYFAIAHAVWPVSVHALSTEFASVAFTADEQMDSTGAIDPNFQMTPMRVFRYKAKS